MSEVTETALIPLDKIAIITEIKARCERYKKTIVLPIKTADEYVSLMETVRVLDSDFKMMESIRKTANEPWAQKTKEIGDECNPIKENIDEYKKKCSDEVFRYRDAKKAEDDALQLKENQKYEKKIEAAEAKGKDVSTIAPPPIVQTQAPKVEGMSTRTTPKFECSDVPKFVNWCIDTKQYHLLTFNEPACVAMAKVYGKDTPVPGARFFMGQSITQRRRGF
jgi:hypothetical protein